jgi:hypothetical protein
MYGEIGGWKAQPGCFVVECEEFSKKKAGHGKEGSKQATQTKKQP